MPNEPAWISGELARSLLKVVVLLTDRAVLPPSKAGLATVMLLPARTTGRGPPARVMVLVSVTALLACNTPLDRDTGPTPNELALVIWSVPAVPRLLARALAGIGTVTKLVSGPE